MRSINASIVAVVVLMGCCCPRFGAFGPARPIVINQPRPNFNPPVQNVNPPPEPRRIVGEKYAYIQKCLQERRTKDDIKGFTLANASYREAPPEGAVLIGFQVGLEKFVDDDVIASIRPIFSTRGGEKMGNWVGKENANPTTLKAKAGYCVGSLNLQAGLRIDGFSVKFVKLENDRLNPDNHYTSPWVGGHGGGPSVVGGAGVLAIGICGHINDGAPTSLGLTAANLVD